MPDKDEWKTIFSLLFALAIWLIAMFGVASLVTLIKEVL